MSVELLEPAIYASYSAQSQPEMTQVVEARDFAYDALLQKRASCLIGKVALERSVYTEDIPETAVISPTVTLSEAIARAREGDLTSRHMVHANVTTDYLERAFKAGFISEVQVQRTDDSNRKLMQFGQNLEDVHLNSLRYMQPGKLRERSKTELLNGARDQYYVDSGLLKNKARVVFSLVHEDMSAAEAEAAGFFVPTYSLAMQLLTELEDGEIIMQTAFVAGRENESEEPFDKQAIVAVARNFGIDYEGATTEQILSRPFLIDKKLIPNLICDVARHYDQAVFEVTGKYTFFGLSDEGFRGSEVYLQKHEESRRIAQDARRDTESVVLQLLARRPQNPVEATTLLSELNDALLKRKIIGDTTIDARVLGTQAAHYVEHARHLVSAFQQTSHNDALSAQLELLQRNINRVGRSSSCPSGIKKEIDDLFSASGENSDDFDAKKEKLEDCEFISKQCPKCGEKNVRTECRNGKYYGACGCESD